MGHDRLTNTALPVEPLERPPHSVVVLPGSKSLTNRALITAALAHGTTEIEGLLFADDTRAMIGALRVLGIEMSVDEDSLRVVIEGCGGELPGVGALVDARQSGTTGRFLPPLVALGSAPVVVDGDDQLRGRPMEAQIGALRELGVAVAELGEPGRLPLSITGPLEQGSVAVAGDVSSQFVSGLLLAGAVNGLDLRLTTEAISRPYLQMTTAVMAAFGATVSGGAVSGATDSGAAWSVGGGYRSPGRYTIEPDASAASYFLAAAAITGGRVRIDGLGRGSLQGDVAFADVLAEMGAEVSIADDFIEVSGGKLRGIDVDLRHISDTAPTLAVVAAFAEGVTAVSGIGFIREKESDRIAGPVAELNRCGISAEETPDGFVVRPEGLPRAATFHTYDDHRMAMAFALIGLVIDGVSVRNAACVAKTFPGYFSALDQLR